MKHTKRCTVPKTMAKADSDDTLFFAMYFGVLGLILGAVASDK